MQQAVITGERRAEVVETDDLFAVSNWAVVKIHAAPMCTEYKAFLGGGNHRCLGHEAAGEVVEVAQPGKVKVGDRVVVMPTYPCGVCDLCVSGEYIHCQHGVNYREFTGQSEGSATYAQYLLKPDWLLPKIPADLDYDLASLACCGLGPSFGAFHNAGLSAFDTVLITGCGPVGLGAVINAAYRGARIIVCESIPYRVEKARELGAAEVVDPRDEGALAKVMELTGGRGVDLSLDCSGVPAAERFCIDATRRKGKVAYVGECFQELPITVSSDLIRKGLTILGSWHYNLSYFPLIVQVLRESPVIEKLISHTFPMSEIQTAFETSAGHDTAKIMLHPWG